MHHLRRLCYPAPGLAAAMDRKIAVALFSAACFLLSSVYATSHEYSSTYDFLKCAVDVEVRPRSTAELAKAISAIYTDATAKGSSVKIRASIK